MIAVLRGLFRDMSPWPPWAVWLAGACAVGSAIGVVTPLVRSLGGATLASPYLEIALNRAWCGRYPYMTGTIPANRARVDFIIVDPRGAGERKVSDIAVTAVGSVREYCAIEGRTFAMNEITFALIQSVFLWWVPDITFSDLANGLAWLRVVFVALFGAMLVRLNYSPLFVFSATGAALYLTVLLGRNALYSQYPFVLPLALLGVAAGGLCLSYKVHHRIALLLPAAFGLGFWAGALGNLRTSQYPGALLIGVVFLLLAALDRGGPSRSTRQRATWCAWAACCWLAGIAAFDLMYIKPVRAVPFGYNSATHVIAHPLVLGLANPPNELSKREGIEWHDPTGIGLAQRIDPNVTFLGDGYERALFSYYVSLWQRYPGEMFQIYVNKTVQASQIVLRFIASVEPAIFWTEKDGYWLGLAVWPLKLVAGLLPVPLFFAAILIAALRAARSDPARAFLLSSMGLVGLLAFAESAIILGGVVLWYSSVFVYCTVFSGLLTYQAAVDVTANQLGHLTRLVRQRSAAIAREGRA